MMKKVQILKDTSKALIPAEFHSDKTLVVYRDGYRLPEIKNAKYVEFEKYRNAYTSFNPENIVMVGTNRIFVPQIRCDMVFEYLQTMTPQINKISIDNQPFIGEPWRVWFHYSLAYGRWLGYTYSYVVETDWSHWFYRDTDSSCIMRERLKGNLLDFYADIEPVTMEVAYYSPDIFLSSFYNELKKTAFEKYGSPKQIIVFMLRELNKKLEIDYDFDAFRKNLNWNLPDFGIYRFIHEENIRRMNIYNLFTKSYGNDKENL